MGNSHTIAFDVVPVVTRRCQRSITQFNHPLQRERSVGWLLDADPPRLPSGPAASPFGAKMRNFVEHCLYDKPTLAPAEHGLMVQKMLDGIYASAAKGAEVKIR